MRSIAVHGRQINLDSLPYILTLFEELSQREKEVIVSKTFRDLNHDLIDLSSYDVYSDRLHDVQIDAVFSIGGDGTLLETITHVGNSEIPVLGINTGRLGFLATTSKWEVKEALDALFTDQFTIENRSLVMLETSEDLFEDKNYALNEFAILRRDRSSMITVKCFLNGNYLNTYWADGLMVSTPTGSTGYSLSCGGPILMPSARNFILTPVSPHNLNIRPLVIPDDGVLTFEIESRETKLLLSLDSRSAVISQDLEIKVRKADFSAMLYRLHGSSFVETLRNKLGWGFDKRN